MSRCAKCDQEVTAGYVLCRRCYERMEGIKEAAIMQEEYQHLIDENRPSKKAMCALCVPFRDKYGLSDLQTLRIARKEMSLMEMLQLRGLMEEE